MEEAFGKVWPFAGVEAGKADPEISLFFRSAAREVLKSFNDLLTHKARSW